MSHIANWFCLISYPIFGGHFVGLSTSKSTYSPLWVNGVTCLGKNVFSVHQSHHLNSSYFNVSCFHLFLSLFARLAFVFKNKIALENVFVLV